MRSNYRRLGEYIKEVNFRNSKMEVNNLLGINIDKFFMPSVANTVGTDLSTYKIVKKGQFACNRMHVGRDYRLPIGLSQRDDEFIVSPAYDTFEIIDTKLIIPEFLMLWFTRREFDRNAWFYTDADVRGGLHWDALCDMQLPIPSPAKQREVVEEYNVIQNRIKLNQQLIEKLEETAQTIYKRWFVDFELPDDCGKPYKSNGGEMAVEESVEIPTGWHTGKLIDLVSTQYGYTASASESEIGPKFLRITDIAQDQIDWDKVPYCRIADQDLDKYQLVTGDVVVARTGVTVGFSKQIHKLHPKSVFASYLVRLSPTKSIWNQFVGLSVESQAFVDYVLSNAEGSAQPQANATLMSEYPLIIPTEEVIHKLNRIIEPIHDQIEIYQIQITKLRRLASLLLSRLATIEE